MKAFFLKIWKDPVWSKLLAGLIGAGLSSIPIAIWWTNIVLIIANVIMPFMISNLPYIIIVLLLLLIIIQNTLIFLRKDSKGLKWLKIKFKENDEIIAPLFWFPLNGLLKTPMSKSDYEVIRKVSDSKIMRTLVGKGIIKERFGYMTVYYSINDKCYDFLDHQSKDDKSKYVINKSRIKNTPFEVLILSLINYKNSV